MSRRTEFYSVREHNRCIPEGRMLMPFHESSIRYRHQHIRPDAKRGGWRMVGLSQGIGMLYAQRSRGIKICGFCKVFQQIIHIICNVITKLFISMD